MRKLPKLTLQNEENKDNRCVLPEGFSYRCDIHKYQYVGEEGTGDYKV
jgi:hypothetical protein